MSKRVEAQVRCPACDHKQDALLFRTIWIEEQRNMDLILSDQINRFYCNQCGHDQRLEFPFLATNVKRGVAIWYEPYHDDQVDNDIEQYRRMMGENSYYAKAPRIRSWQDFKQTLVKANISGPVTGQEIDFNQDVKSLFSGFLNAIKGKR